MANNVEQVVINTPAVGEWHVMVDAASVNVGDPGQGYALVATAGGAEEPPETVFKYAAKLVCGLQKDPDNTRLAQGFYATAINIHNPNPSRVEFEKKLSLTFPPEAQAPGKVRLIGRDVLDEDQALETDCIDIQRRLFPNGLPRPYIKGFVTVTSKEPLNVTAVYSTRSLDQELCCDDAGEANCCRPRDSSDCCNSGPQENCCDRDHPRRCCTLQGGHSSIDVEQVEAQQVKVRRRPERLSDLVPADPPNSSPAFCLIRGGQLVVHVRNQGSASTSTETITRVRYNVADPVEFTRATSKLARGAFGAGIAAAAHTLRSHSGSSRLGVRR